MPQSSSELKNEITRAGAGAGKTRSLIAKVVETFDHFQRTEGRSPRIVVTTFTRKATQELKERLLREACERKDPRLIEYMSDGTRLHISTIHGLLSLFLRQVAHLADLDSGFQVMDETVSLYLRKQVLREILVKTPESLFWLENFGFERVLDMCASWSEAQFENGPLQPATLEDLERAAAEQAARVRSELQEVSSRILEEADDSKWQEYGRQLLSLAESWDGNQQTLTLPKKASLTAKLAHLKPLDEEIKKVLKKVKDSCEQSAWRRELWPQMIQAWHQFQALAANFHQLLLERKQMSGQLDMSDLEFLTLRILREKSYLAESFSQNWDRWMVDEFQDTSQIQSEILLQLIDQAPVYYVGDPQQSIYLFRGARAEIFDQQWRRLKAEGGILHEKQQNWRSTPALLHFINDMVSDLGGAFQKMIPRDENQAQRVASVVRATTPDLERQKIVAEILQLIQGGARFEQICILGRKHRHLMDLARVLKEQGLPTHVHSPAGFWQRRETKDIHSLWRFLLNPHDNVNLVCLLRTPYFYCSDIEIAAAAQAKPQSLWRKFSTMTDPPEIISILQRAQKLCEELGIVAALEWAIQESGVFDLALKSDPAGRKESNLWKFLNRVKELEREGGSGFLSMEPTVQDEDNATEGDAATSQEPNCINLMTIHGSKGLEFDYVMIPHMGDPPRLTSTTQFQVSEGRFSFAIFDEVECEFVSSPLERRWVSERSLREREESLRWLYVAMTRAKQKLWLSTSEIKNDSWAARLNVFTKPQGVHQTENYQITVEDVHAVAMESLPASQIDIQVRELFRQPDQAPALLRRSVTELLSDEQSKQLPANVVFAIAKKKSEGVLIHQMLEALRYGTLEFTDPTVEKAVDYVQSLESPPMMDLLEHGEAEWGFQIQTDKGLLEGQIDLWGKVDGSLWLIDYKSGTQEFKEKAFEQLALYTWALRQFGHKEPVQMAVIYPLAQYVEVRKADLSFELQL